MPQKPKITTTNNTDIYPVLKELAPIYQKIGVPFKSVVALIRTIQQFDNQTLKTKDATKRLKEALKLLK